MTSRLTVVFFVASWVCAAPHAGSDVLAPGTRVRVTGGPWDTPVVGTLSAADEATLTLQRADGEDALVIPRAAIGRLDVFRPGTKRATGKGIVLGFLGGLTAGFVYGMAGHPGFDHAYEAAPVHEALAYGVVAAIPGAVLGGVMGHGRDAAWREVPLDSRIRIGLGEGGRAATLCVAVTW